MTTVAATTAGTSSALTSLLSSSSTSSTSSDFSTFLKLFTTEVQNQDPTSPMDTTQMTNQLAEFSMVEQQASTNSKLDKLLTALSGNSLTSAVSYIGKTVQASGDEISLSSGSASIGYSLPSTAASVSISVMNGSGTVIDTLSGDTASGSHTVSWDGTDSAGNTLSDGTYCFKITATDSSGSAITATTYTTGKVTGVETSDSATVLSLGSLQVKLADVTAVTN
ncbi:MAG: flagellar hook assembly protein FlgD [Rhodospirillaceae bacterium]